MTIYRERRPIHPGEILAEDVLAEQTIGEEIRRTVQPRESTMS